MRDYIMGDFQWALKPYLSQILCRKHHSFIETGTIKSISRNLFALRFCKIDARKSPWLPALSISQAILNQPFLSSHHKSLCFKETKAQTHHLVRETRSKHQICLHTNRVRQTDRHYRDQSQCHKLPVPYIISPILSRSLFLKLMLPAAYLRLLLFYFAEQPYLCLKVSWMKR